MTQIPPMQPPPPGIGYGGPPVNKPQGLSITSMILGIASIVFFCAWYLSVPMGIAAIVLAVIARGKIARGEAEGAGMAKAGLITGIIGVILSVLFGILIIAGISIFGDKLQKEIQRQQEIQQQQQQQRQNSTPAPTTGESETSRLGSQHVPAGFTIELA